MQIHVCEELFKRKRECVDFCLTCLQQLLNTFTTAHLARCSARDCLVLLVLPRAAPLADQECEPNSNSEDRGKIVLVHQLRQWEH